MSWKARKLLFRKPDSRSDGIPENPTTIISESINHANVAFIKSFNHFGLRPPMMCCQPSGVWLVIRHEVMDESSPDSGATR
ncbi:Uncharacterised protein [Mycobacteroides abscessus subsp. massiliense]|nr:Uncharacterised protein [Mycobacteroides abscessus subsp. massiliense]